MSDAACANRQARRVLYSHALASVALMVPWPALLVIAWSQTESPTVVGLVGAARLAPFVFLSLPGGLLADRLPRLMVFRWSVALRVPFLAAASVMAALELLWPAVALTTVALAIATPAYPASVALVSHLDRVAADRYTTGLVTLEVSSFIVGPAIGGLLIACLDRGAATGSAAVLAMGAVVPLVGLSQRRDRRPQTAPSSNHLRQLKQPCEATQQVGTRCERVRLSTLWRTPGVTDFLALMCLVNVLQAAASITLIELSSTAWTRGDEGYGWAASALGLGAMAAPVAMLMLPGRRRLLAAMAPAYMAIALAPGVEVALIPLVCVGAATTGVEVLSTQVLQRTVPDTVRASILGLANTLTIAVSMVAALVAPILSAALTGPRLFFVALGLATTCGFALDRRLRSPPTQQLGRAGAMLDS